MLPPFRGNFKFAIAVTYNISVLKVYNYAMEFFINLLGRAFRVLKNGIYFIAITFLVAELFEILIYAN